MQLYLVSLEYPVGLDFRGNRHLVFDKLVVVFHRMVLLTLLVYLVILEFLEFLEFLVDLGYLDKLILDMKIVERKILVFLVDLENLENPETLVIQETLELQGMKVSCLMENLVILGFLVDLVILGNLECLVILELLAH